MAAPAAQAAGAAEPALPREAPALSAAAPSTAEPEQPRSWDAVARRGLPEEAAAQLPRRGGVGPPEEADYVLQELPRGALDALPQELRDEVLGSRGLAGPEDRRCFAAGVLLKLGQLAEEPAARRRWYLEAAGRGSSEAMLHLGELPGCQRERQVWWLCAALLCNREAMRCLGGLEEAPPPGPAGWREAAQHGVQEGSAWAAAELGRLLPREPERGLCAALSGAEGPKQVVMKAAARGVAKAMLVAAELCESPARRREWLRRAAELDEPEAARRLGLSEEALASHHECYVLAAEHGDRDAAIALASFEESPQRRRYWQRRALEQGRGEALVGLECHFDEALGRLTAQVSALERHLQAAGTQPGEGSVWHARLAAGAACGIAGGGCVAEELGARLAAAEQRLEGAEQLLQGLQESGGEPDEGVGALGAQVARLADELAAIRGSAARVQAVERRLEAAEGRIRAPPDLAVPPGGGSLAAAAVEVEPAAGLRERVEAAEAALRQGQEVSSTLAENISSVHGRLEAAVHVFQEHVATAAAWRDGVAEEQGRLALELATLDKHCRGEMHSHGEQLETLSRSCSGMRRELSAAQAALAEIGACLEEGDRRFGQLQSGLGEEVALLRSCLEASERLSAETPAEACARVEAQAAAAGEAPGLRPLVEQLRADVRECVRGLERERWDRDRDIAQVACLVKALACFDCAERLHEGAACHAEGPERLREQLRELDGLCSVMRGPSGEHGEPCLRLPDLFHLVDQVEAAAAASIRRLELQAALAAPASGGAPAAADPGEAPLAEAAPTSVGELRSAVDAAAAALREEMQRATSALSQRIVRLEAARCPDPAREQAPAAPVELGSHFQAMESEAQRTNRLLEAFLSARRAQEDGGDEDVQDGADQSRGAWQPPATAAAPHDAEALLAVAEPRALPSYRVKALPPRGGSLTPPPPAAADTGLAACAGAQAWGRGAALVAGAPGAPAAGGLRASQAAPGAKGSLAAALPARQVAAASPPRPAAARAVAVKRRLHLEALSPDPRAAQASSAAAVQPMATAWAAHN